MKQQLLLDRRVVLRILEATGVPTPRRVLSYRPGDTVHLNQELIEHFQDTLGLDLSPHVFEGPTAIQLDYDTIQVGDQIFKKPFVEKPISGENHNIYIFFSKESGGGARKLFRKVLMLLLSIRLATNPVNLTLIVIKSELMDLIFMKSLLV